MSGETEKRLGRIEGTLETIAATISEMAKAVVTLAKVEERVAQHHEQNQDGMERLGNRVDDHEERIKTLESSDTKQTVKLSFGEQWFWVIVGAIVAGMV